MICPNCATELESCDIADDQCLWCGHVMKSPIYHNDFALGMILMIDLKRWMMQHLRDTIGFNWCGRSCPECGWSGSVGDLGNYYIHERTGQTIWSYFLCPKCGAHAEEDVWR